MLTHRNREKMQQFLLSGKLELRKYNEGNDQAIIDQLVKLLTIDHHQLNMIGGVIPRLTAEVPYKNEASKSYR